MRAGSSAREAAPARRNLGADPIRPAAPASRRRGRIPGLDVARSLAILGMMVVHYVAYIDPDRRPGGGFPDADVGSGAPLRYPVRASLGALRGAGRRGPHVPAATGAPAGEQRHPPGRRPRGDRPVARAGVGRDDPPLLRVLVPGRAARQGASGPLAARPGRRAAAPRLARGDGARAAARSACRSSAARPGPPRRGVLAQLPVHAFRLSRRSSGSRSSCSACGSDGSGSSSGAGTSDSCSAAPRRSPPWPASRQSPSRASRSPPTRGWSRSSTTDPIPSASRTWSAPPARPPS